MKLLFAVSTLLLFSAGVHGQSPAITVADKAMQHWPDTGQDLLFKGLEGLWYNTGDARYYRYIQQQVDRLAEKEANLAYGRTLLMLYSVTGQEKYYRAANLLRHRLQSPPGTSRDSFWLAQPFLAEYASHFHEDSVFDDITRQFAENTSGWNGMTLVDVLDYFPSGHPGRKTLQTLLTRYAAAAKNRQDPATVYALAKGVRKGYLAASYRSVAEKAWEGHVPPNDPAAMGAWLLAADEMAMKPAKGKTVLLDYYFNNEHRKDITGATIRFHYCWDEMDNNGYAIWGHIFQMMGARTDTLTVAPTAANLATASVYIIVDPDNERESPIPNYPSDQDIGAIENWVKAGGVLVLMANDSANCEFIHFNRLAARFGVQFNYDCYHKVPGNQFEMGAFTGHLPQSIFPDTKKIYIKELSTLLLSGTARPVFTDSGHNIMAVARVGEGTVFAVGDPWFYNEYTDGRKLPPDFENYSAARDFTRWVLQQAKTKRSLP